MFWMVCGRSASCLRATLPHSGVRECLGAERMRVMMASRVEDSHSGLVRLRGFSFGGVGRGMVVSGVSARLMRCKIAAWKVVAEQCGFHAVLGMNMSKSASYVVCVWRS
jgi:hypothetical protein